MHSCIVPAILTTYFLSFLFCLITSVLFPVVFQMLLLNLFMVLFAALSSSLGRKAKHLPLRSRKTWSRPSHSIINEKECGRVVYNLPRFPSNNIFPGVRSLCVRLKEAELLSKLKNIGGFNPRYMATKRKDAFKFSDLSGDEQSLSRKSSIFPPAKHDQPPKSQTNVELSANSSYHLMDQIKHVKTSSQWSEKRMVSLSPGSVERGCWRRGSVVEDTSLVRLCTECAATTKLPTSVFPPFINEVICGDVDHHCYGPIGQCAQRVLRFTFLRRTGEFVRDDALSQLLGIDVNVEEWEDFEQDIRSCCECRLFSFLARQES